MSEMFSDQAGGLLAGYAEGSQIAAYRLEERVGAGGMAVVFRARDERLGRRVALKVLAPGVAADEAFRRRFIRESRAAAAVDDPHIIPVFEAGEAAGVLFIAMRYVPGGDVRSLVRRVGPLPPGRAAAIVSAVASALDAAHAAGLVHRDVKSANMLVDVQPGRPDHVYLSDFGLCKGALSSQGLTASGQFLGTPGYAAPEQMQGKPADGRADQYSLGCVAFELLSGGPPFPRDQITAVIWAHMSEQPPPLTSRRPGLPTAVDDVLARALAKAPTDRYASCREFADALRVALGLEPYTYGSGTTPDTEMIEPPVRRQTRHARGRKLASGAASYVTTAGPGAAGAAEPVPHWLSAVGEEEQPRRWRDRPGHRTASQAPAAKIPPSPLTGTSQPSDRTIWLSRKLSRGRLRAALIALIILAALGSGASYLMKVYVYSQPGKSNPSGESGSSDSNKKSRNKSDHNPAAPTAMPTIPSVMAGSWSGTIHQHSSTNTFDVNFKITMSAGSRSGLVNYSGPFTCSDSLRLLSSSGKTLTMAQEIISGPCQSGTMTLRQSANNSIEATFRGKGAPPAIGTLTKQ